jgi:hypothetical protein
MSNDDHDESTRSPLDVWHFAIAAAGFFVAAGGVVISSVCVVFLGLLLMGWGLGYFLINTMEV